MVFIAPPFLSDAFLLPLLLPLPYGTIVKNVVSKKTDSKQGKVTVHTRAGNSHFCAKRRNLFFSVFFLSTIRFVDVNYFSLPPSHSFFPVEKDPLFALSSLIFSFYYKKTHDFSYF